MNQMIDRYGSQKRLGKQYDAEARDEMKQHIDFAKKQGKLNSDQAQQMKKIIDTFQ